MGHRRVAWWRGCSVLVRTPPYGVWLSGRAPVWGTGSRGFDPRHPDARWRVRCIVNGEPSLPGGRPSYPCVAHPETRDAGNMPIG